MRKKEKILFLCTHNSSRSQMAEALVRSMYPDMYDVYSAGVKPTAVNPHAISVMAEIGIDMSKQKAKSIKQFKKTHFDYVVTVCNNTRETCPFFPASKKMIHRDFNDPSAVPGSPTTVLAKFRQARDEIRAWIEKTFGQEK